MEKSTKTRLAAIEAALRGRNAVAIVDACGGGMYCFVIPHTLAGQMITAEELANIGPRYNISHTIIDDL